MPFRDDGDDDCLHLDTTPATILAPYQRPQTPHPSPSQRPHATLPVSHASSQTPLILGALVGVAVALVALALTVRHLVRRRIAADPFKDPPKQRFAAFRLRPSNKRLSDESWVSPALPSMGSSGSPLTHDLELRRYTCPQRKLVPVTTPVCTPTDTEFGFQAIPIPPVRVPSPVYFSPFSPSPSLSSSSSSLSPTPSTEPLSSPPSRLSRLLSSTFGDTRVAIFPTRPSTASSSLYAPRLSGTRSRTSFYHGPWDSIRDTISTVTTSDTDTVPHLHRAVAEMSPFADPEPVGTSLGLKLRLSDASEHARYRSRERERQRRRRERDLDVEPTRREFKLRDSESVLREIGW